MNIPNFIDSQVVDKDGKLTDTWKQILSQLFAQLQGGLSEEGILVPQQKTENINLLTGEKNYGKLIYDSSTNKLKINLNGTFKTITTD